MKIGDMLDPVEIGHSAIDWKNLAREAGYTTAAVKAMERVPEEVKGEVERLKGLQERYTTLEKPSHFICRFCGDRNSSQWRYDVVEEMSFVVCGSCHRVVEVG